MKVKICGVTTHADARLAVDLGADFIGLNFYRPGPRWIDVDEAAHIRRGIGDRARTVGIRLRFWLRGRRRRVSLLRKRPAPSGAIAAAFSRCSQAKRAPSSPSWWPAPRPSKPRPTCCAPWSPAAPT